MAKSKKRKEKGYKFLRATLGKVFKLWYNPKVYGKENIPKDGPILITANHKHVMDQCAIIIKTKRVIHYMAKKEYFEGRHAWFFKMAGCIRVDRSIHDESAKEQALEILSEGGAIGLFPEGTRNKTDAFQLPFKFGAVSMAKKTDAYLVPVGISGDYKFRSKNLEFYIGKPFKVGDMSLEEANEKLARAIGELMLKGKAWQGKEIDLDKEIKVTKKEEKKEEVKEAVATKEVNIKKQTKSNKTNKKNNKTNKTKK